MKVNQCKGLLWSFIWISNSVNYVGLFHFVQASLVLNRFYLVSSNPNTNLSNWKGEKKCAMETKTKVKTDIHHLQKYHFHDC